MQDSAADRWVREVEGHLDFLEKLAEVPLPYGTGESWRVGMRRHYIRKVRILLDATPRGQEKARKAYEGRLVRV